MQKVFQALERAFHNKTHYRKLFCSIIQKAVMPGSGGVLPELTVAYASSKNSVCTFFFFFFFFERLERKKKQREKGGRLSGEC